ncbi:Asparagine synthase [compost metagenome]
MISCKLNLKTCDGLPIFSDNTYKWIDGSHLSILDNPNITSMLFHSIERWICIVSTTPHSTKSNQHIVCKNLSHADLSKIYNEFSSIKSEGLLIEFVTGQNGNILRAIATNEGSIPIYFCNTRNTVNLNWDFREIASTKQSLILDFEYLVKSTFEPTYTHRTAFQGISMLTAGSSCTFSDECGEYKYPKPEEPSPHKILDICPDEAAKIFSELLQKKLSSQLTKECKIAIELSGGLDSSTVAMSCAQHFTKVKLNTYGIIVSDPLLAKSQQFRRNTIIESINGNDHKINIKDHLPLISSPSKDKYYLNSEAYGSAFESIWNQAANDGQSILINGCGGDELFPQFPDEDFSTDRLRSIDDRSWLLYNQHLMNRITPRAQDVLCSHLLLRAPHKNVDTGMLLAMARRAPLLLSFNLIPVYPLRDNEIINFCSALPVNLRLNKTLFTHFLNKKTQSSVFTNYPKETFMHADEISLLKQKKALISKCKNFKVVDIDLINKKTLIQDLEQLNTKTPRHIFDYLLNILAIERFLGAYL